MAPDTPELGQAQTIFASQNSTPEGIASRVDRYVHFSGPIFVCEIDYK